MDNRLREIRVVKRITQFHLRLLTGIHQSKISLIENGLVDPREDERSRIAKALGLPINKIWNIDNKATKYKGVRPEASNGT